jgi:hypothetical protein
MEKCTIPSGLTATHGHSGVLGQSPASWLMVVAFGQPMPPMHGLSEARARSARSHRVVCDQRTRHARGAQRHSDGLSVMRPSPRHSIEIPLRAAI